MCEFLEAAVEPLFHKDRPIERTESMLAVPRGCYKTTLGSVALPIWLLVQMPNLCILLDTHTSAYSREILSEIKWHMEFNARFKNLFGELFKDADRWAGEAITINTRSVALKEPSIDTAGVDAPKTGGHYDLIIPDDLINEKTAHTAGGFRKVDRHVKTLTPILKPNGCSLFIFTRWAHNDVYGHLLDIDEKRVREGQPSRFRKLIRGAWLPDGRLFAPSILPESALLRLREDLTDKEFAVWYLNEPVEEGTKVFPRSVLRFYTGDYQFDAIPFIELHADNHVARIPVYVTMAVDPALSASASADFTGITVVGTTAEGVWYVIEADNFKGLPDAVIERIVNLAQVYKPRVISLEAVAAQILYRPLLVPRLREAGLGSISIHDYKLSQRRSKAQRIESLQPRFKAKGVYIHEGLGILVDQLNRYPEIDHDDLVDSLAQHIELSRPPRPGEAHPAVGRDWFDDYKQWSLEEDPTAKRAMTDGSWTGRHGTNIRKGMEGLYNRPSNPLG
jgi:predicted phage terminase large subunit-like protein